MKFVLAKKIITSFLHGFIIAQNYGIPVNWIQIENHVIHEDETFKFYDYLLGTEQLLIKPDILKNDIESILNYIDSEDGKYCLTKNKELSYKLNKARDILWRGFPLLELLE